MSSCDTYMKLIRGAFPGLSFDQGELITKGWDHDDVVLDSRIVFRFPKNDEYKRRFRVELALLREFAPRSPVQVPAYAYVAENPAFGGYHLIPGTECRLALFETFSHDQQQALAKDLAAFLTELHSTPLGRAREMGVPKVPLIEQCWGPRQLECVLMRLREKIFPALAPDEVAWAEEQFAAHFTLSFETPTTLIHFDISDDHILVDANAQCLTGIIDFGDAEIADPAMDFAGLWLYGEAFVHMAADNYGLEMSDDFLRRSKIRVLMSGLTNMLEIAEADPLPVSYEESYQRFKAAMHFGLRI